MCATSLLPSDSQCFSALQRRQYSIWLQVVVIVTFVSPVITLHTPPMLSSGLDLGMINILCDHYAITMASMSIHHTNLRHVVSLKVTSDFLTMYTVATNDHNW